MSLICQMVNCFSDLSDVMITSQSFSDLHRISVVSEPWTESCFSFTMYRVCILLLEKKLNFDAYHRCVCYDTPDKTWVYLNRGKVFRSTIEDILDGSLEGIWWPIPLSHGSCVVTASHGWLLHNLTSEVLLFTAAAWTTTTKRNC